MTKIEFSENKCWLEVCHLISKECILLWECAGQIQVAAFRKFMADLGQFHRNEGTEHQGANEVQKCWEKVKLNKLGRWCGKIWSGGLGSWSRADRWAGKPRWGKQTGHLRKNRVSTFYLMKVSCWQRWQFDLSDWTHCSNYLQFDWEHVIFDSECGCSKFNFVDHNSTKISKVF